MSRSKKRRDRTASKAIHIETSAVNNKGAGVKLFVIVAVLVLATVSFGAFIKWHGAAIGNERAERASAPMQPLPTPEYAANKPAKEYVYGSGKLIAVSESSSPVPADLAVWRPGNGTWFVMGGLGSQQVTQQWGGAGDIPVPGDYDGDGKTDFSIFRPSDGTWWVLRSSDMAYYSFPFGQNGDIPAVADFDGDGKTDAALVRHNSGSSLWYVQKSSDGSFIYGLSWGVDTDIPGAADFDGDGRADIAVYRPGSQTYYSINSSDGANQFISLGQTGDKTVSADYDGDSKADFAIYNSSTAAWTIRQSTTGTVLSPITWGSGGDKAVQNDYDGDGKCDIAVWHDATGVWTIRNSQDLSTRTAQWGLSGDIPVPALYRR